MKIKLRDVDVVLTGEGTAFLPEFQLLCATDLHFEKGSFFSRFATLLPPYDSDETLKRLEVTIKAHAPQIFVALGDSFHDVMGVSRLRPDLLERLTALVRSVPRFIWITGNHDSSIGGALTGERLAEFQLGGVSFRHVLSEPSDGPELSGHYHPKAAVSIRGHKIRAPCFLHRGDQLILPSFGTFTGGLDADSEALLAKVPASGRKIYLLHSGEVFAI